MYPSVDYVPSTQMKTKKHLGLSHVRLSVAENHLPDGASKMAGAMSKEGTVMRVGVQAGSGGSVLRGCGADLWLTGECYRPGTHSGGFV